MIHSGLLVCSFYIKERYVKNHPHIIELNNEINIDGIDNSECYSNIWDIIRIFLNYHTYPHDDESSMKLFSVEPGTLQEKDTLSYHAITFVVNAGSYGIEGKITNRTTKNVVYNRSRDDADVKQFYAMIYIPKDKGGIKIQKGIFIFQSIGTYGIKTITTKQMREYLATKNLTLETRSVSIALFLRKILQEGKLSKITLLRNAISPDPSDCMLISSGREERVYVKPKLKENWINKITDYADGKRDDTIFEINDSIYEDISITFNFSGRTKTARLRDLDKFSLTEDIPDSIYNNGMTKSSELIDYMIKTADEYAEKMIFYFSK